MSTPAGETTLVRAVAVGNRIILPATELAFVAELERIVGLGAHYLSPSRPNILVLGEVLGLPAAFTGQRALLARCASTTRLAMTAMAAQEADQEGQSCNPTTNPNPPVRRQLPI